jgi:hypothetical protein
MIQYNLSNIEVCLYQKILLTPKMKNENKCKVTWNQQKLLNTEMEW